MNISIANIQSATLPTLKAFADKHGINPVGDRRRLDTWRSAIIAWWEARATRENVKSSAVFALEGTHKAAMAVFNACGVLLLLIVLAGIQAYKLARWTYQGVQSHNAAIAAVDYSVPEAGKAMGSMARALLELLIAHLYGKAAKVAQKAWATSRAIA